MIYGEALLFSENEQIQWIRLGIVGKTHKLDGSFYISDRTLPLPKSIEWIIVGSPTKNSSTKQSIERSSSSGKKFIAKLKGFNSIEEIEPLKGMELWTSRDQIVLNNNEYLWADLEGKVIVDSNSTPLGTIVKFENYGASDLVEIKNENEESLLLPFNNYYFDMTFTKNDKELKITVSKDIFSEYWQIP